MMKVMHGRGGNREIVCRGNATGIGNALGETAMMFGSPPAGHRGERLTIAQQRGTRGQRLDCTVVYYHADMGYHPLNLDDLEQILEDRIMEVR